VIDPLTELADRYGTDKGSRFHNYTRIYDLLLGKYRQQITRVLEIGILEGASLRMWRDYFPNAAILGVDKEIVVLSDTERIFPIRGDVLAPNVLTFLRKFDFDLIVDDGSHDPEEVRQTFVNLFPLLRPGGIYSIEDLSPVGTTWLNETLHALWWIRQEPR
jgi:SAM-dependent methyltransferase